MTEPVYTEVTTIESDDEGRITTSTTTEVEDHKLKLTFLQRVKQLTGIITAIATLIAALSGLGITLISVIDSVDKQDKVQESTYNLLSKRIEELTITIAVLKENNRLQEKNMDNLVEELRSLHSKRHKYIRIPMKSKSEDSVEAVEAVEIMTLSIEAEHDDEIEVIPQIQYKGVARLPDFKNIQQIVGKTNKPVRE